jgi:hypothetical protein
MKAVPSLLLMAVILVNSLAAKANAGLTVTGTVTGGDVVPVIQPMKVRAHGLLKLKLESQGSVLLCLGTFSDIFGTPPRCGKQLGDPVGPGGRAGPQAFFLLNANQVFDRFVYIFNHPGDPAASFTLTLE